CNQNRMGVINLSLGSESGEAGLREALADAINRNCMVVVAAGNDGRDIESEPYFPASLGKEFDGLLTVAATTNEHQLTTFSNYSPNIVEIAAPGEDILSLSHLGNSYVRGSGTSYAAPIVTAAMHHMLSAFSAAGLPLTPSLAEEIFKRAAIEDPDLTSFVEDGRRLDMLKLKETIETYVTNLNHPQIGLGEPEADGSGFNIPLSFSRGANGYVLELVQRLGTEASVMDQYTIGTTFGSLEFSIPVFRPERTYYIELKTPDGVVVSTIPLPDNYFYKPDISNRPILGKIHQVYKAKQSPYDYDYVFEGWACIQEYPEALELEVWKGGAGLANGGELIEGNFTNQQRARGEFYEACQNADGNPHPSISLGFWIELRQYTHGEDHQDVPIYILAKHPENPALNRWLTGSGEVVLPKRSANASIRVEVTSSTVNQGGLHIEGWACGYYRNEKPMVSLAIRRNDFNEIAPKPTYVDKDGVNREIDVAVSAGRGTRGGCSRSLPYPVSGALCNHSDIDGESRSFQDLLLGHYDNGYWRLKASSYKANSDDQSTSCFFGNRTEFEIDVDDLRELLPNYGALIADIPEDHQPITNLVVPTTNQVARAVFPNIDLYIYMETGGIPQRWTVRKID
ncbi:MAG: S8 family serine peptidase, partial [Pseudomonadota bacterium]